MRPRGFRLVSGRDGDVPARPREIQPRVWRSRSFNDRAGIPHARYGGSVPPSIQVAPATREEHEEILALHREAGWPDTHLEGEVWVLRDLGGLVGSIQLIELVSGLILIGAIVVRSDARGRGLGSEMARCVLTTRTAEWWLECREQRMAFYGRLGFAVVAAAEVNELVRERVGPNSAREQNFMRRSTSAHAVRTGYASLEREHGRVMARKHGQPAGVVLSVEDLDSPEETLAVLNDEPLMREVRQGLAEIADGPAARFSKSDALALTTRGE